MVKIPRWLTKRSVLVIILSAIVITIFYVMQSAELKVSSLIMISLDAMVPLGLAAIGEVVNERAGTTNIGLEGTMLLGSFVAVLGAEITKSWAGGIIIGIFVSASIGLLHGLISIYAKGDQIISGMGINLFAAGFVAYGIWTVWVPGAHMISPGLGMPRISTPWGGLSWFVPLTIVLALVIHFIFYKTRWGVWLRAAGESPGAVDASGINVFRLRFLACIFGATLAGLAGAFMSLDWVHMTTDTLSAGRGFIALACVVFSGLRPISALGAAIIFGFFGGLSTWMMAVPQVAAVIPPGIDNFVKMIPYIVTLVAVAVVVSRRRFPKSVGRPYRREEI
jgi:simple sugar transport system permease protein